MSCILVFTVKEWSLIKGREGLQNGRVGGQVKFYPYKKRGGGRSGKVLAILKGGHKQFWGSFNTGA